MAHAHGLGTLHALLRDVARQRRLRDPLIDVRPMQSDGANFTSRLYLATISADHRHLSLFAKVGCFSDKIRAKMNADRLFRTEHLIYTKLAKTWDGLQEKYRVPERERFVFPEFYGAELELGSETVVLEDLAVAGYGGPDRLEPLDWERAAAAVDALARFHALSFALERERPAEYAEAVERLRFQPMSRDAAPEGLWQRAVQAALQALPPQGAARDRAARYFAAASRHIYVDFHAPRGKAVLVHGDYRPSNVLFRREEGEMRGIVIDYQMVYSGCPAADVLYLEVMGTDAAFRREHHARLLDRYHGSLARALSCYRIHVNDAYPDHEFHSDFKQLLPYALMLGATVLPVATVAAECAPRTDADADADLDTFLLQPGPLFTRRFRELVDDLLRWEAI